MKPSRMHLAVFLFACSSAYGADFIRQIDVYPDGQIAMDLPVSGNSGEITSNTLAAEFSQFQLYATYVKPDNSSVLLKLDEKSVGTYLPKITIETYSADPYQPTRTRADQPYGVRYKVSGLRSGASDPDYTKTIVINRGYQLYSPATYEPTNQTGTYAGSMLLQSNGTVDQSSVIQMLPVASPTKAVGKEIYTANLLPSAGVASGQLGTNEVVVWPVADAAISGIVSGAVYNFPPRTGVVTLTDVYPSSRTYVQIYRGIPALGTVGSQITGTVREFGTTGTPAVVPKSISVPIGELGAYVREPGDYTVEVLTITPFNNGRPERLAHVSFTVTLSINVNAMIVDGGDDPGS